MTTHSRIRIRALLGAAALALPLATANAADFFPQLVVTVVPPNCKSDWVWAPMPSSAPGKPTWDPVQKWREKVIGTYGKTWARWEHAAHKDTVCSQSWGVESCVLVALPCRDPKHVDLPAVGTVTAVGPTARGQ